MSLFATRNLTVSIADVQVCAGLDITIAPGECWGLLGKNGSGKTTLLQTLAGLRGVDSGEILLKGHGLHQMTRRQVAQTIGIVFQDYSDIFPSTVLESALIGRHPYLKSWEWESPEDIEFARSALKLVEMDEMASRIISTLSGGERQRVEIATLLTQDPQIYLLDEPTNHLDLNHQIGILQVLQERISGCQKALIMVVHDLNIAARFCDHLILLFGDGVFRHGTTNEMMTEKQLAQLYDHPIVHIRDKGIDAFLPD